MLQLKPQYREFIRDEDGNVVQRSRNLAGIRRYVGKHLVRFVHIEHLEGNHIDNGGRLVIKFENGNIFISRFESFTVLLGWVARWQNVWGATLWLNWNNAGTVGPNNEAMKAAYKKIERKYQERLGMG